METIEIDFEVHQLIEMERRSFEEPKIAALRRLLRLADKTAPAFKPSKIGRSWFSKGVELPHGTKLRMEYNGQVHEAQIDDGAWICGKKRFKSPSGAASALAITKSGGKTKLDGWIYWEAQKPGSTEWIRLRAFT